MVLKKFMRILLWGIIMVVLSTPTLSLAAPTVTFDGLAESSVAAGLVTCNGPDCTFCSLIKMVDKIIDYVVALAVILAILILVYTGFRMVASQGNSNEWGKLKEQLTNIFIGLLLILAAWTLVDTLMKLLVDDTITTQYGPWHEIKGSNCGTQNAPGQATSTGNINISDDNANNLDYSYETYDGGATISESGGGINGAPRLPTPISVGSLVTYAGARFDAGIVEYIKYIDSNFDLRVSGGYRTPERNAAVGGVSTSYHLTGRAGDFVGSMAEMQRAQTWAKANGAREALIHNAGSGTHLHVAW